MYYIGLGYSINIERLIIDLTIATVLLFITTYHLPQDIQISLNSIRLKCNSNKAIRNSIVAKLLILSPIHYHYILGYNTTRPLCYILYLCIIPTTIAILVYRVPRVIIISMDRGVNYPYTLHTPHSLFDEIKKILDFIYNNAYSIFKTIDQTNSIFFTTKNRYRLEIKINYLYNSLPQEIAIRTRTLSYERNWDECKSKSYKNNQEFQPVSLYSNPNGLNNNKNNNNNRNYKKQEKPSKMLYLPQQNNVRTNDYDYQDVFINNALDQDFNYQEDNNVANTASINNNNEQENRLNVNNDNIIIQWTLDSGASYNMTHNKNCLSNIKEHKEKVYFADGSFVESKYIEYAPDLLINQKHIRYGDSLDNKNNTNNENYDLWHRRLGHFNINNIKNKLKDIKKLMKNVKVCSSRIPLFMEINISLQFLMIIQDRYGWYLVPSSNGTKELRIFLIKILNILKQTTVLNITISTSIISVRIIELYIYISIPYNPQQNGKMHNFTIIFGRIAVDTANYIHNRLPHKDNNNKVPFESLVVKLFTLFQNNLEIKFANSTFSGIFLGYDINPSAYRSYDPNYPANISAPSSLSDIYNFLPYNEIGGSMNNDNLSEDYNNNNNINNNNNNNINNNNNNNNINNINNNNNNNNNINNNINNNNNNINNNNNNINNNNNNNNNFINDNIENINYNKNNFEYTNDIK
ncbi:hypothetical protein H8356DRAFT_1405855 [Neocallimastix lanati (nom. inval.)]|nr:hypothetical protein H8356DRAFT_1405855 [Neocallimastix sp. JGI-2020a]